VGAHGRREDFENIKQVLITVRDNLVMRTFKVGDTFWSVGRERPYSERHVVVTNIGRKWATLDDGKRFDITSEYWYRTDGRGYTSPSTLYDSEESYLTARETDKLIGQLRKKIEFFGPERIDVRKVKPDDVRQAAKLLGVEIDT
jgi:hypothetical protein